MKKSKFNIMLAIGLALLVLMGVFDLGFYFGGKYKKLDVIMELIDRYFVLDYDKDYIEDVAAEFMVKALGDPHSDYIPARDADIFNGYINGRYVGVGIVFFVDSENNTVVIEDVEKGSPAEKAGIKVGDIVVKVDDIKVDAESYEHVYYYINGTSEDAPKKGAEMTFGILRDGKELEFKLKKAVIERESVVSEMKDGILYIKLMDFTDVSKEKFFNVMYENKEAKGIILDLRDNGGGSLDSLLDIAERLLPEGVLLTVENAKGKKEELHIKDDDYFDVPLAVLVDELTASASEVLAAAVKETGRGVVIGETTYGKGLVQSIITLGDGSILKLTIEKYYTAGGNYINDVGVVPDIIIEDKEEQLKAAAEYILNELK